MTKPVTTLPESQVTPDPKLEKRTRRRFSTEYKLRILAQADACAHGELGELLRKEKLYSSQLQQWRRELASGGAEGLAKTAPGPAPRLTAEQRRIAQLEREVAQLSRKLQVAQDCIGLQKKVLHMLDRVSTGDTA